MFAAMSSGTSCVRSDESKSPHSSKSLRTPLVFSLEHPGALPALLAGCGVQQATNIRGNTCTVLWDRVTAGTKQPTSDKQETQSPLQDPSHHADDGLPPNRHSARAVPHRSVPTRVLETAVAPFLAVILPTIGVCPIPVLPRCSTTDVDNNNSPGVTKDTETNDISNDCSVCPPTTAQVFVEQFQSGAGMLLPRIVVLPARALCATDAGGCTGERDARVLNHRPVTQHGQGRKVEDDDEHEDGTGSINEDKESGDEAAVTRTATTPAHDPWERLATTAVVRTTGKAFQAVSVAADDLADTLSKISMAAPFVDKLDLTDAAAAVAGDLCLTEATVAQLSSVTAVDCGTVALPVLRSLLLQLNNDRRFSGVSADGAVAALPRKQCGTQVESLDVFNVSDDTNIAAVEVGDDYSNLTELRCFSSPDILLYFLRSARRSLRSLALGFGSSNFVGLMAAARREGFVSDAVGPNGAMVESIGHLLPCLTAATFIECTVEKGAFASLVGRMTTELSVDDCDADGDDFLEFCRHPSKPTAQCHRLNFRTASFSCDVVAAAMDFFPSLTSYSCASGTNYGALLSISKKRRCETLSVIGTPDGATLEDVADTLTEIVQQPRMRSANLVDIPAIDAARVNEMRKRGRCSLRVMRCAPICDGQAERVRPHRPALLALLRSIRYDQATCRLVLPEGTADVLTAVDTPLFLPDSERDLTGDIPFVTAHALPTQHLPPPCTIEQGTRTENATVARYQCGVLPPSGETMSYSTPKLTNITPVVRGETDLPTALPAAVRIATGQLPLLRTVNLGGPAAVLLSVMDHCPLLVEVTWALGGSAGDDPLLLSSFGDSARSQPRIPANVDGAAQWVGTSEAAFPPTCFQTLITLTLDYQQNERTGGDGGDSDGGSDSTDRTDDHVEESADDGSRDVSQDDDKHSETAVDDDDSDDGLHSSDDDGSNIHTYCPYDARRKALFLKVKTFAAACALFVKACPALAKLSLTNAPRPYDEFNALEEFVAATVKDGRCCKISRW